MRLSYQQLKLSHKGLIVVAVILASELLFLGALNGLLQHTEQITLQAQRAKQVLGSINHIWQLMAEITWSSRQYQLSQDRESFPAVKQECKRLKHETDSIEKLATGTSLEKTRAVIRPIRKFLKYSKNIIEAIEFGDTARFWGVIAALEKQGVNFADMQAQVGDAFQDMRSEQSNLLINSSLLESQIRLQMQILLAAGIVGNVLLSVMLTMFFARGITQRLLILVENTRRVADGISLNPALCDLDEIGHLDRAFHDMAVELAESKRKERAVVENSRDVICVLDDCGKFLKVSPASRHVWGYEPHELVGKTVAELLQSEFSETIQQVIAESKKKQSLTFENIIRHRQGTSIDTLWSSRWHQGEQSLFCVAHDITERKAQEELLKQSEKRVRSILDNMPVGLMTLTDEGILEYVNPRVEQILRRQPGELVGRNFSCLFPAKAGMDQQCLLADLRSKACGHVSELSVARSDRQAVPVEISLSEFCSPEGRRLLANLVDISEKHEIDRMKQEFFAMISHDLRTPLGAVQGFLELLTDGVYGELSEECQTGGNLSMQNTHRLLQLVNDILDVAKLEAGQMELQRSNTNLAEILDRLLNEIRPLADERRIGIETSFTESVVNIDTDRIGRVLGKLLANAVKFSPENGIITVSIDPEPECVVVSVQDQGKGMSKGLKESIFERFRRLHIADGGDKSGTGLGLTICKAIAEAHGGTVGVESQEGKGTMFWLRLPRAKPAAVALLAEQEK